MPLWDLIGLDSVKRLGGVGFGTAHCKTIVDIWLAGTDWSCQSTVSCVSS